MSAPELRKHTYLEPWEPLALTDEVELTAQSYAHEDGRHHVYFWTEGEDIRGRELGRDVTRIGYRVWPDGVQFMGMTVAKQLRGMGASTKLIEYFMDHAEDHEDIPFTGTGTINKPLIALALTRAGLDPVSEACMVEILPRSSSDEGKVPKIHVVSRSEECVMVDRSHGGRFFEVVPPDEVERRYPINDPGMTVALHTQYAPAA
jgi:GNAT superfamily N-acetyltransferase